MARPLDTESKAFGFLKVRNLYLVVLTFIFGIAFIPILARPFGIKTAFFMAMGLLMAELLYFALSNNLPDHFILNWIRFHLEPQHYFPGHEKPERPQNP
jgi:hypothetical protein